MRSALILVGFLLNGFSYAKDCDPNVLVLDSVQEQMNLTFDNNYYLKKSLSQEKFCKVISRLSTLFPSQSGIPIKFSALWDLPDPNALADFSNYENAYTVDVYGGLLNLNHFTEGALVAITCHELGHIMGGTKKSRRLWDGKKQPLNTAEGFADYFASHVCMKKYYSNVSDFEAPRNERIGLQCEKEANKALCLNVLNAAFDDFYSISKGEANLDLPSKAIAANTSYAPQNHPAANCRFDIMIAGYLCSNVDRPCGFNKNDQYTGKGNQNALPPRCFFKP